MRTARGPQTWIAVRAIERLRRGRIGRQRGQAGARRLGQRIERQARCAPACFSAHSVSGELGRGRLQQQREVDVEGAEAHAVLAQLRARRLIERLDLVGDHLALQDAEVLLAAGTRCRAPARRCPPPSPISTSGFSFSAMVCATQASSRACTFSRSGADRCSSASSVSGRLQRIVGRLELGDLLVASTAMRPCGVSWKASGLAAATRRARMRQLAREHLRRRVARRLAVDALAACVSGEKRKPLSRPTIVVLDVDRAVLGDLGVQLLLVAHALHERAGAPVDEALRQALVQRVRKPVLDRARAPLPVGRVLQPVGAVRDERPRADVGDAVGERVDVAVGAVGEGDLLGEPVLGDALLGTHERTCRCVATSSAWFWPEILR